MVSSVCRDSYPHCLITHGTAIILFPLQSGGEGSRFGFFAAPRTALHNPGGMAGLCGYLFFNQLVSWAAFYTTSCRGHVIVSWPSLCIAPWGVSTSTPLYLAIPVGNRE